MFVRVSPRQDLEGSLRSLGEEIRRCRIRRGMSQATLGARVGVHQTTILRLEHGRMPNSRLAISARVHCVLEMGREHDRGRAG
jgi:DNA-binding XRE family transcriptional regulator